LAPPSDQQCLNGEGLLVSASVRRVRYTCWLCLYGLQYTVVVVRAIMTPSVTQNQLTVNELIFLT